MSDAIPADCKPVAGELQPGTYWWCACGRSKEQPFCDGSHTGTTCVPIEFTIEEPRRVALCACKRTKNGPFCDGSHKAM